MRCPVDGKPLHVRVLKAGGDSLTQHDCDQCRGAFIGGDVVQRAAQDGWFRMPDVRKLGLQPEFDRPCPHCKGGMAGMPALERHLDVCPSCLGVWFDPGELRAYNASPQKPVPTTKEPGPRVNTDRIMAWWARYWTPEWP